MESCFTTNPVDRPSAKKLREKATALLKKKKAHIDINYEKELEQTT